MPSLGREMKSIGPKLRHCSVQELTDYGTSTAKLFFVYHMGIPKIDPISWRLVVTGSVERETILSLADISKLPQVEVTAFHECAGSPFRPTEPVRRVANVVWRGARVRDVLAQTGLKHEARYLWSYGADHGDFNGVSSPCYLKDLPIDETQRGDLLLATHVNGEALSDEHGGPIRLVVPGYYGTNSTKWLVRLEAREIRSPGYFTTALYNDRFVEDGIEQSRPVWRVAPHADATLTCAPQTIWGWAWGAEAIARVEVSTDGSNNWAISRLEPRVDHSWQRFDFDWTPPHVGEFRMRCRAVDKSNQSQPEKGARNEVIEVKVTVA
jgi:DMSO/TMAO reductase YedYZ molybdopterin-dependent catalytic subunit